jgi:hypothetical protein
MVSLEFVFVCARNVDDDYWDVHPKGQEGTSFRIYWNVDDFQLRVFANRPESFAYLGKVDTLQQAEELILWAMASTITEENA